MSNHLYRLVLQVPYASAEAFAEAIEIHCDTVAWTECQGETTAKVTGFSLKLPKEETVVRAVSITAEAMGVLTPEVDISQISPKNWVLENIKQFSPLTVGRFFIYGSDFDGQIPVSRIPMKIPAGTAFGTGNHGSTQGCLIALNGLKFGSVKTALDMGCGSGILAIAIAKRWRCTVVASDKDIKAVRIARKNVADNGERSLITVVDGPGYQKRILKGRRFNLIISNILARPLVKMSNDLSNYIALGGTVVLAGLLASQEVQVLMAHRMQGLKLKRRIRVDGWSTLVLQKYAQL